MDDTLYYLNDANMNPPSPAGFGGTGVTAVIDGDPTSGTVGEVVERYAYDPYGRVTVLNGEDDADGGVSDWTADADNASDVDNRILYCGYRLDPETGAAGQGLYHVRNRHYHPTLGRWTARDFEQYVDGPNLYEYTKSRSTSSTDPHGTVTFEQINAIAAQLDVDPIKADHSNATATIKAIQRELGFKRPDGDFGPRSVLRYEQWAKAQGVKPVKLRDSKSAKTVLTWIVKHWPETHKCARDCPVYYGGFLALIHYESMDLSTRKPGNRTPVYFNAVGGPYASRANGRLIGTTAVGLAQFTAATAPRAIAYDGEKSIQRALELCFQDAAKFDCDFSPKRKGKIIQRALNRWEAWYAKSRKTGRYIYRGNIVRKGKKIDKLIEDKYGGDPAKVTNAELNAILGIQ